MGKSIIKNGGFEDNDIYATPWTCPGNCGINTIAKAKQPQEGDNFAYLVGQNTLGQITSAKKGETYNLTYYAYGFTYPPADPNALVGWGIQFGPENVIENGTKVFSDANVQPPDWPRWTHQLNASDDGIAITFLSENNTVFFVDNVSFDCVTCSSANHTGSIIGGVIGGLAGLGALVLAAGWFWLRVWRPRQVKKRKQNGLTMEPAAYSGGTMSYGTSTTGRYASPSSGTATGTMDIMSSQGHGSGQRSEYGRSPEVEGEPHDLRRPDVYPVFRSGSER